MEMSEMELLVDLVKRSNVRELTLRNGEARITLKKACNEAAVLVGGDLVPYQSMEEFDQHDSGYAPISNGYQEYESEAREAPAAEAVTAPLVGIFHHVKP